MMFLTSGLGLCGVGFLSWLTIQETSLHALFGWSMCIILLFLIYFLLLFYSKYVGEQKQRLALEMKEQMIDREYDLMVRQQREQEELSHDMKNHLLVLSSMIGEGKMTEAQTYLERMGEPLRQLEMMVWTGNPVLDVLLNNARNSAAKNPLYHSGGCADAGRYGRPGDVQPVFQPSGQRRGGSRPGGEGRSLDYR